MPENYQLTPADWNEAKKLLTLSEVELHKLRLVELRAGVGLLRAVGDSASAATLLGLPVARVRLIALKSENVYAVTNYRINGGSLSYVLASGGKGSVDITEVDWRATSRLNADPVSSTDENSSRRTY